MHPAQAMKQLQKGRLLVYEKKQKCSYSSPVMHQAVLSGAHTFLTGVITPYLYYIILAVLLQLLSSCFLR